MHNKYKKIEIEIDKVRFQNTMYFKAGLKKQIVTSKLTICVTILAKNKMQYFFKTKKRKF